MHADNAHKDTDQMLCKEHALELSQHAHALKCMMQVVTNVLNAHHTKLQLIIINNAFQLLAQTHYKFLVFHQAAINAETALMDLNQIT